MLKKEQKKIIVCLAIALFYTIYTPAHVNQRRSSIFSSLDAEDNEIESVPSNIANPETTGASKQIFNNKENTSQQDYFFDEPDDIQMTDAVIPNIPNSSTYESDPTGENQSLFEILDMPDEFTIGTQMEGAHLKQSDKKADGSPADENEDDAIEFHFEDADIQNLLTQISSIFDVNFITDEILNPLSPAGKALKGNKISFKTHAPLSRQNAWNLFLTFLDLAGFALVPQPEPNIYRITTTDKAQQSPVPTFIGTSAESLPDNDQMIRFVYFIENADMNTLRDIVGTLKSPGSRAILLQEIKALVITDRAYNIKSLMQIVQELDQVSMPQSMAVLKLKTADVNDVKKLYDAVSSTGEGAEGGPARMFGARKQSGSIYFPENARIIAEPRTNSLILLGPKDAIKKIEDFIIRYVDVELEKPYSPLQTYQLRYASAVTISEIMNNMSQFGSETAAGKAGGVRGGDKYLKPITFTPEPATNNIVIKGDYEDYLKALEIIKRLDAPQPQVAIEALILTMNYDDNKEIGTQIRNKVPGPNGLLGNNVDFQTSGIRLGGTPKGIQTNPNGPGADRLLANLINLVTNAAAGNTVVSLGADAFGVWGIFNILQTISNVQVVSNPFLVATNKTKAKVSVGEIRRVVTSTVYAGINQNPAFGDFSAQLQLEVTPQINSDGMIILKLNVLFENFISSISNDQEAAKLTRTVDTRTIVADKEVIAIGGLVENRIRETLSKVPILGDIPVLGWFFRNKGKAVTKNNLLILISTRIIEPEVTENIDEHTQNKLNDYYDTIESFHDVGEYRDPVYRRFFDNQTDDPTDVVENFFFNRRREVFSDNINENESPVIHTTRDGKFYRPGAKKDTVVIMPPDKNEPVMNTPNESFNRSPLIKSMMSDPEPIHITQKTSTTRRRDARRSIRSSENEIGVLT
jgi:general secretion pathway protein D